MIKLETPYQTSTSLFIYTTTPLRKRIWAAFIKMACNCLLDNNRKCDIQNEQRMVSYTEFCILHFA